MTEKEKSLAIYRFEEAKEQIETAEYSLNLIGKFLNKKSVI